MTPQAGGYLRIRGELKNTNRVVTFVCVLLLAQELEARQQLLVIGQVSIVDGFAREHRQ